MVTITIRLNAAGEVGYVVDGDIGLAAMIGVLEMVKAAVQAEHAPPTPRARPALAALNGNPVPRLRG